MTALYDEGDAERVAAEWAAQRRRDEQIRAAATQLVEDVAQDLTSAHAAHACGMPAEMQQAVNRAYERLYQVDDLDVLRDAIVGALWQWTGEVARDQLLVLRDCHYIDERHGLVPVPPDRLPRRHPGAHRAG